MASKDFVFTQLLRAYRKGIISEAVFEQQMNELTASTGGAFENPLNISNLMAFRGDGTKARGKRLQRTAQTETMTFTIPANFHSDRENSHRGDQIIYVRVAGDPMSYASAVEQTVHGLNPDLPLFNETTLAANMRMGNAFERIAAAFSGSFGLVALILAAIGVYGVVAYATKQRTHEIGIRMAMGARSQDILRMILREGMKTAAIGGAIGLAISIPLPKIFEALFVDTPVREPSLYFIVPIVILVVVALATYIPARWAARVDPMNALRQE